MAEKMVTIRTRPKEFKDRKVVGTFKVLHGLHSEGEMLYHPNDVFESRYNLNLLNAPGCQKFQQVGELNKQACEHNDQGASIPLYQPDNPQTLQPAQKEHYERTLQSPAHTPGSGEPNALGAGGIPNTGHEDGGNPQGERGNPSFEQNSVVGQEGSQRRSNPQAGTQQDASGPQGAKGTAGKVGSAYSRDELHAMTVADLKELAADNEVELGGATKKDEIIDAILEA